MSNLQLATCIGGVGSKQSNGGTQYFQQDRVYYGDIALCCPANLPSGSYMYVIKRRSQNEQRYNGKSDKS